LEGHVLAQLNGLPLLACTQPPSPFVRWSLPSGITRQHNFSAIFVVFLFIMSPLKEEQQKTSSSDEVASLLDDDDSVVDTDDEEDEDDGRLVVHNNGGKGNVVDQRQQQTPCSSTTKMVNTRDAASRRNSVASNNNNTASLKQQPPAISTNRSDHLSFDLNQPWERSLARQLERVEHEDNDDNLYRPDFMLVGHTESTDFGLPIDHDEAASLGTSVSSTVPTRNQFVHRSVLLTGQKPVDETFATTTNDKRKNVHARRDSVASQLTVESQDERDDSANSNTTNMIPKHLLEQQQQRKAAAASQSLPKSTTPYLELEGSTMDDESIQFYANNDPACFCLGYNVFDYVLPPPTQRHGRGSRSSMATRRNSQLFRVDEYPVTIADDDDKQREGQPQYNGDPEGRYQPYSLPAAGL